MRGLIIIARVEIQACRYRISRDTIRYALQQIISVLPIQALVAIAVREIIRHRRKEFLVSLPSSTLVSSREWQRLYVNNSASYAAEFLRRLEAFLIVIHATRLEWRRQQLETFLLYVIISRTAIATRACVINGNLSKCASYTILYVLYSIEINLRESAKRCHIPGYCIRRNIHF